MPQDELWASSARLTGWTAGLELDVKGQDVDKLTFVPRWSKVPGHARSGSVALAVPTYCRDYVPGIISVCHEQILGGLATNVPRLAQRHLELIRHAFQEGRLH